MPRTGPAADPADRPARRRSTSLGRGVVLLAAGGLLGALALTSLPGETRGERDAATVGVRTATTPLVRPDRAPAAPSEGRPVRLQVPRLGVDTALLRLGLDAERELEVPPMAKADTAGWYDASPVPGDLGPSVVAGHVDSRRGPAVFYRLRELRRGDRVVVDRSDGRRATFTVDRVVEVPKADFPTRRVYGATERSELRLITCGGTFDTATDDYLSNVVVFAHLTHLTHA